MKNSIKRIISFALMLSLLVGMMAGFSVFAAETESSPEKVAIVKKNVLYGDTLNLMYAVNSTSDDVVVNVYDAENKLVETIDEYEVDAEKYGTDAKVFISKIGVPAQNIDTVFYAEAVAGNTKSATVKYSVLEYLYERLYVSENVTAEQTTMYKSLLAFADAADVVVNKDTATNIAKYAYVTVTNGTVDGTYASAMVLGGTALEFVTTDLVAGKGMKIVWEVTVDDVTKTVEEIAEYVTEAGKAYTFTAVEVKDEEYVEEVEPVITTTKYTFANYPAGVQYAKETHKLDDNTILTIVETHLTQGDLRIYSSSSHNGNAIIKSVMPIQSIAVNAGFNTDNLVVYGSNDDGVTWNEIATISVATSSEDNNSDYKDYTADFNGEYTCIKLDVSGSKQVRLKTISLTTVCTCAHESTTVTNEEPTCTLPGYEVTKCNDCGLTTSRVETVAAKGHSYDDGVASPAPNCTTPGVMVYTCVCGHTESKPVDALGHTVEDGTCDRCGEEVGSAPVEPVVVLEITVSDFNTTSYAANNTTKTENGYSYTSYQVMNQQSAMQWQKNKGYITTNASGFVKLELKVAAGTYTVTVGGKTVTGTTANGVTTYDLSGLTGEIKISVGGATGKVDYIKFYK